MIFEIPIVADVPDFTQGIELDGRAYILELSWSGLSFSWYFSLALQTDDVLAPTRPLVEGVRVAVGVPPLLGLRDASRPAGELLWYGITDPSLRDLGTSVRLLYADAAELGRE